MMHRQKEQDIQKQLREKIACLNRMVRLGREQSSALQSGSEPLRMNLEETAKLIRKVDQIDRSLNPLQAQLTPRERERFHPERREIKALIQEMMGLEKESIRQAREKMAEIRREIDQRRKSRRAVGKYTQRRSESTARFLDLREG